MKLNISFFLLSWIILAETTFGKTLIRGHVVDRQTNSPIPAVNIIIEGTTRGTTSDGNGDYSIEDVIVGKNTITVSAIGYIRDSQTVMVSENETVVLDFSLAPDVLNFTEVTTTGERTFSAASSGALRAMDFDLRPKQSAQDLLRIIPGIAIAQHAGGGKAEQIFIRGFDADHGTDINLSVDGVPVNMVSHGHGQGYADLHFVIPEVIEGLEVYKGPYFAQFGDLATAGSVRLQTRESLEYNLASVEGGEFGTYRAVGMLQLPIQSTMTSSYLAGEYFRSDGYFDTKIDFNRYNVFGKLISRPTENGKLDVWVSAFSSNWNATGQIPERAVAQGIIGRYGSIDPTEGGRTSRHSASISYLSSSEDKSTLLTQVYFSRYQFNLFSNFTFFANDPVNGDGIEQNDDRFLYGARLEFAKDHTIGTLNAVGSIGASFRADDIDLQLYHQSHRVRLSTTADALIHQKNISFFAQEEFRFSEIVKLQLGLRADMFFFDVEDQLSGVIHIPVSGSVSKAVVTPKTNLVISPNRNLDLFFNFGGGFHSNDARAVASNKAERTLPRAWGSEVGTRIEPVESVSLSFAVWGLDLQNEFVYVGDEGTTEISGATRRTGVDIEARARLSDWLYADVDMTFSRGRFKNLPEGDDFIPLAPTFTSNAGLTARHTSGTEGSLRLRHVGNRPANESNTVEAKGYTVFDAAIAYSFLNYRVQVGVENLFNTQWNEAQFDTESRLLNETDSVSELHYTPGTPLNLKMKIEYHF